MHEEFDFSKCKFIINQMSFITYFDFCDKCDKIKQDYLSFNENERIFYRWYVYANIHMNEIFKNAIWDFLNSDEIEYRLQLMKLKKIYHAK